MIFPSGSAARAALGRGAGETEETACFSLLSLPHGPHSLSRIPQGSYSSLPAADILSPGTRYVISFRWRHISVPAQWHVSPQPSFQKGSLPELGGGQPSPTASWSIPGQPGEKRWGAASPCASCPLPFPQRLCIRYQSTKCSAWVSGQQQPIYACK